MVRVSPGEMARVRRARGSDVLDVDAAGRTWLPTARNALKQGDEFAGQGLSMEPANGWAVDVRESGRPRGKGGDRVSDARGIILSYHDADLELGDEARRLVPAASATMGRAAPMYSNSFPVAIDGSPGGVTSTRASACGCSARTNRRG